MISGKASIVDRYGLFEPKTEYGMALITLLPTYASNFFSIDTVTLSWCYLSTIKKQYMYIMMQKQYKQNNFDCLRHIII